MTETTLTVRDLRAPAWSRLTTPAAPGSTVTDAMRAAGLLGWDVETMPLVTAAHDGSPLHVPGQYATVRRTAGGGSAPIGVVGEQYEVVQNEVIGQAADAVVTAAGGAAEVLAAGPYRGSRQVYVALNLPSAFSVGGQDVHDLNVVIGSSHDGSLAFTPMLTTVRIACMNSFRSAAAGAVALEKVRHTSTSAQRIAAATAALEQAVAAGERHRAAMERLLEQDTTSADVEELLTRLFPVAPQATKRAEARALEARDGVRLLAAGSDTTAFGRGTRYGLFQAATEYLEWVRPSSAQDYAGTWLLGAGQQVQARTLRIVTDYSPN